MSSPVNDSFSLFWESISRVSISGSISSQSSVNAQESLFEEGNLYLHNGSVYVVVDMSSSSAMAFLELETMIQTVQKIVEAHDIEVDNAIRSMEHLRQMMQNLRTGSIRDSAELCIEKEMNLLTRFIKKLSLKEKNISQLISKYDFIDRAALDNILDYIECVVKDDLGCLENISNKFDNASDIVKLIKEILNYSDDLSVAAKQNLISLINENMSRFDENCIHILFKDTLEKCKGSLRVALIEQFVIHNKLSVETIDAVLLNQFKHLLFNQGRLHEITLFQHLTERQHANVFFDTLLGLISEEEYLDKGHRSWRSQMQQFAFSSKRYHGILMNPKSLFDKQLKELVDCFRDCRAPGYSQKIEKAKEIKQQKYSEWLTLQSQGSTTLTEKQLVGAAQAERNWSIVQEKIRVLAESHRQANKSFDWSVLEELKRIHQIMTEGEVTCPGKFRNEITIHHRADAGPQGLIAGSGETRWDYFCHPGALNEHLDAFVSWLAEGLEASHRDPEEFNPIVLAAQAYQRFLALHPFENGNGRISRLLLDYLLARFEIPPCILTRKQMEKHGVFPLRKASSPAFHHNFLREIIEGVYLGHVKYKEMIDNINS